MSKSNLQTKYLFKIIAILGCQACFPLSIMEGMEEKQSLQMPISHPRGTSSKTGSYSEERPSTGLSSWEDSQEGEVTRLSGKKRKRDIKKAPSSKRSNKDFVWKPAPLPLRASPPLKHKALYEELKTIIKNNDPSPLISFFNKLTKPLILYDTQTNKLIKSAFEKENKIFITEILMSKNFPLPPFDYKVKPNILSFVMEKKFKPVLSAFLKRQKKFQIDNFHLAFKEEGFMKGDETLTDFLLALDDKTYGKSRKKSALNILDGPHTLLGHAVSATGYYREEYTLSERISLIKRLISLERVNINKRSRKRVSHPIGDLMELYQLLSQEEDKKLVLDTMETFALSSKMEKTALFKQGNALRPIISFFIQNGFYDMGRKLIGKKFSLNIRKGIAPFPLRTVEDFKMLNELIKAGANLERESFKEMLCQREIFSLNMDTLEEYGKSNFSEFYIPPIPSIKTKKARGKNTLKIEKWKNLINAAFIRPVPSLMELVLRTFSEETIKFQFSKEGFFSQLDTGLRSDFLGILRSQNPNFPLQVPESLLDLGIKEESPMPCVPMPLEEKEAPSPKQLEGSEEDESMETEE
jgi:hypothetical protein